MSFSDASVQKQAVRSGGAAGVRRSEELSDSLQNFQRGCQSLKDKVTELRRRKVNLVEKADLDEQIKLMRDLDTQLKVKLDTQYRQLEAQPRTAEVAAKRTMHSKLSKDYDKIKAGLQMIVNDATLIKASQDASQGSRFSRIGDGLAEGGPQEEFSGVKTRFQEPAQLQVIQGQEVDDYIAEERAKEIQKMNTDLLLVNEMMRDMANIVQAQGAQIEEIHTATESSHEKAQAGLEQVKQAAAYQPGCVLS